MITAHFLAPGRPAPVGVDRYVEKRGRRFTTVSAKLADETRPVLAMLGSFADRDTDSHPVTTQPRARRCRGGVGLRAGGQARTGDIVLVAPERNPMCSEF